MIGNAGRPRNSVTLAVAQQRRVPGTASRGLGLDLPVVDGPMVVPDASTAATRVATGRRPSISTVSTARGKLRVQLATDVDITPVADASVPWPEDITPYRAVATLEVAPQDPFSAARRAYVDDLSFGSGTRRGRLRETSHPL